MKETYFQGRAYCPNIYNVIPDILQIFVAANKASLSNFQDEKLTKTIHTEVLFNLSPTKKGM